MDDPDPARPHPVRRQHHLPHPVPDDHDRARLVPAVLQAALQRARGDAAWLEAYTLLGQGLRAHLRAGRGQRHHDELPVRHQLAGLHEHGRQHRRPAARLRGADRVLPRGHLPRHHAVRHATACANWVHIAATVLVAVGTTLSAFWILALNSWMQTPAGHEMLDGVAHATDWLAIDLQSVVPLPPDAHAAGLGPDGGVPGRGPVGLRWLRGDRAPACGAALRTGVLHGRGPDPGADLRRRPARPEHARAPAGQDRGDGRRSGRPSAARRWCCSRIPNEATRRNDFAIEIPNVAQPDPHARPATARCKGLDEFRGTTRRSRRCSSPSASWSASGVLMLRGVLARRVAVAARRRAAAALARCARSWR